MAESMKQPHPRLALVEIFKLGRSNEKTASVSSVGGEVYELLRELSA
jgi:hypothetical protein